MPLFNPPAPQTSPDQATPDPSLSDPSQASGGYSGTPTPQASAVPAGVHPAAVADVAKHAIFGRAVRSLVHSIEGTRTVYQPNPQTGQIEEATVRNSPGQLFRNILMGSLIGGAAASERSSGGAGGGGFLGGFARGGAASIQAQRQQDQNRFTRPQEQLKTGMERERLTGENLWHAAATAHENMETAQIMHNMHLADEKHVLDQNAAARAYEKSLIDAGAAPYKFSIGGQLLDSVDGSTFQSAFTRDASLARAPEGYERHFISTTNMSELHYNGNMWTDDSGNPVNIGKNITIKAYDLPTNSWKKPMTVSGKQINAARRASIVDPSKNYQITPEAFSALYSTGAKEANEGRNNKTKNTFTTITSKKAAALAKAEHEYNIAVNKNPENQEELEQQLRDAKQQAQDSFEEEIESAGGSVKHYEYPPVVPRVQQNQTQQPPPGSRPIIKDGKTIGYYTADGKRVNF
jgi:hypothetical protein